MKVPWHAIERPRLAANELAGGRQNGAAIVWSFLFSRSVKRHWPQDTKVFSALCVLLVATFALGGSARGDVQSLIVLRPLAALLLGLGLWELRHGQLKQHRFLVAMALAIVALPLLQLVPLPFSIWSHFPGREQVVEIDRLAGLGAIARPVSLTPDATLNSLMSLVVPLAALVLGIQLDRPARERLLPLILALAGVSALIGLLQTLDAPDGPLYFYDITNRGAAVGLFANRNHQALLLAMTLPMVAVWATREARDGLVRRVGALVAVLGLLPLILITGSRAGAISGLFALLSIFLILPRKSALQNDATSSSGRRWLLSGLAAKFGATALVLGIIALTVALGRAEAWDRLLAVFRDDDLRFDILPTLWQMFQKYWPVGTGLGSFEKIFQANEPDELLGPVYMNHAHDDWLEVPLTGGLPGAILMLIAAMATFNGCIRQFLRRATNASPDAFARLGLVLILLTGIASISDYPLRTPTLEVVLVVAALWASCPPPQYGARTKPNENQSVHDRSEPQNRQYAAQ